MWGLRGSGEGAGGLWGTLRRGWGDVTGVWGVLGGAGGVGGAWGSRRGGGQWGLRGFLGVPDARESLLRGSGGGLWGEQGGSPGKMGRNLLGLGRGG